MKSERAARIFSIWKSLKDVAADEVTMIIYSASDESETNMKREESQWNEM